MDTCAIQVQIIIIKIWHQTQVLIEVKELNIALRIYLKYMQHFKNDFTITIFLLCCIAGMTLMASCTRNKDTLFQDFKRLLFLSANPVISEMWPARPDEDDRGQSTVVLYCYQPFSHQCTLHSHIYLVTSQTDFDLLFWFTFCVRWLNGHWQLERYSRILWLSLLRI